MPLRVHFELSGRDVSHLRRTLRNKRESAGELDDEQIFRGARKLVREVRGADAPDYVLERVDALETLMVLLRDEDWSAPPSMHKRVRTALAYFVDVEDLIPDTTPALGYLDDAIMIEIVTHDLRHEIKAYRDFVDWRESRERSREEILARRRKLRARIQDGRNRDADGGRFRLF